MRRVLLIGIDALDRVQVEKLADRLPNLSRLMNEGPQVRLRSIFPPDSTPAWISISTGRNPARHGVINFINPADRTGGVVLTEVSNALFQGKTFWDLAGQAGRGVCVVLPFPVYPAYPVNGVMVCRSAKAVARGFPIDTFPASIVRKYPLPAADINLHQGFVARSQFKGFIQSCRRRTLAETEAGLRLLEGESWDLFFTYTTSLDAVQHALWSYYDESHPGYPGPNRYSDVIPQFYELMDEMVGRLTEAAGPDVAVMVMSDHGHGIRPTQLVNINEVLRRNGLLTARAKGRGGGRWLLRPEALKGLASAFVSRRGLGRVGMQVLARFPVWKRVFASPSVIDWDSTVAYASDLSAVKSYSYGGVIVQPGASHADYEALRDEVIKALTAIREPGDGRPLVRWARRREELYTGPFITKYPDVLVELEDGYGLGWDVNCPLTTPSPMHRIQPGSHKQDSAVMLMGNLGGRVPARETMTLMDVAPTVLDLLGVQGEFDFDGESILADAGMRNAPG